jgi:hypothetical protein
MQATKPRETLLNRVVPLMLLGFGALHLVDWVYGGFADPWKLANGVGLLLMGGTHLVANRLGVTNSPGRGRSWLLALGVVGFALAVAAIVHRWL